MKNTKIELRWQSCKYPHTFGSHDSDWSHHLVKIHSPQWSHALPSQPTLFTLSLDHLKQVSSFSSPFPNPRQHHIVKQAPTFGLAHPSRPLNLQLRPLNIFSSVTPVRYKALLLPLNTDQSLKIDPFQLNRYPPSFFLHLWCWVSFYFIYFVFHFLRFVL